MNERLSSFIFEHIMEKNHQQQKVEIFFASNFLYKTMANVA